ncbi:hypothetical protein Tco_0027192 [Tanacetum coccineum]
MESTKMFNLFSAMLAMMAVSAVPLSAADPPAPAPTSDADIAFVSIAVFSFFAFGPNDASTGVVRRSEILRRSLAPTNGATVPFTLNSQSSSMEGTNIFTLCAETLAVMMMGLSAIAVSAANNCPPAPAPTSDAKMPGLHEISIGIIHRELQFVF